MSCLHYETAGLLLGYFRDFLILQSPLLADYDIQIHLSFESAIHLIGLDRFEIYSAFPSYVGFFPPAIFGRTLQVIQLSFLITSFYYLYLMVISRTLYFSSIFYLLFLNLTFFEGIGKAAIRSFLKSHFYGMILIRFWIHVLNSFLMTFLFQIWNQLMMKYPYPLSH